MRELREELEEIRRNGTVIDPDTAAMLSGAAHQLQSLPDSAEMLDEVAGKLLGLEGLVNRLDAAADRLNGFQ